MHEGNDMSIMITLKNLPQKGPPLPVTLAATGLSPAYSVIPRLLWGVCEGHLT